MSNFIYRAIRDDEDISDGIKSGIEDLIPEEELVYELCAHINAGSSKDPAKKRFISMTEKLEAAQKYRSKVIKQENQRTGIILIKSTDIEEKLIRIKSIEETKLGKQLSQSTIVRAKFYGEADSEVLINGRIGSEKIKELSPLMLDVLDGINVTIAKDDDESIKERELLEFIQTVYFESEEFEQVLEETSELNVYEQYFFERFYKHRYTEEQILKEMNGFIEESDSPKKQRLDLSNIEALRVGIIKKLLNSNKTIDFLKKYNDEKYHSQSISEQLLDAMHEKENTKKSDVDKRIDIIRRKKAIIAENSRDCERKIEELLKEINELTINRDKILKTQQKNENDFYSSLQSDVYTSEAIEINRIILDKETELRTQRKRALKLQQTEMKLSSFDTTVNLPEISKELASRFQSVVVRSNGICKLISDGERSTTNSPNMYEKLEQSKGIIACGETSFFQVGLNEELAYVGGTTSVVSKSRREKCLACYSGGFNKKQIGGKNNKERIGKRRITTAKETEFGLKEIGRIRATRGREFSPEFTSKYSAEIKEFENIRKEALTELNREFTEKKEQKYRT